MEIIPREGYQLRRHVGRPEAEEGCAVPIANYVLENLGRPFHFHVWVHAAGGERAAATVSGRKASMTFCLWFFALVALASYLPPQIVDARSATSSN